MDTPTNPPISGLHHVTAITADAQANIDFYCGVLGLRLVKLTVNFDDPGSYHLYYGDGLGSPGTIMTFFAWPGGRRGRIGTAQVSATAFAVSKDSLDFWSSRLQAYGVITEAKEERFGEAVLRFSDPDGLALEIVATADARGTPWTGGPVPAEPMPLEHGIRGFHGVTLSVEGYERTAGLLSAQMGFRAHGSEGNRFRYRAGFGDGVAQTVDVRCAPDSPQGTMGTGVVHHVAFRTPDDATQTLLRRSLVEAGRNASPVMDRKYFHSIYFREPGGILFEIATDLPGFAVDEPADQLGTSLMLPEPLEPERARIEAMLPPVRLPGAA